MKTKFSNTFFSFLVVICLFSLGQMALAFEIPQLGKFHVVDEGRVLNSRTEEFLQSVLSKIKKETGVEMAILTVPSLDGEVLEQATIKVVDQWKLGTAKGDKGILLFLAVKDRKLRIEVGQGLEGTLTDAYSRRVIDDNMVPLLKTGDYNSAVIVGTYRSLKSALPELNIDQYFDQVSHQTSKSNEKWPLFKVIIYLLIFIFLITTGRGGLLGFFLGHSLGRGFGGHYRGGGGSLGGGGGFSGGGSSGSW